MTFPLFRLPFFSVCLLWFAVVWGPALCHAGYGFDVGIPPPAHAGNLAEAGIDARQGTWMRVRGVVDHHRLKESATRTVAKDRAGLQALRERGIRTTVFLRWDNSTWPGGVRAGRGHRMPLDLREAYERGRWLGETYGDLVDVWEIDNEPDIDFGADNPEAYAAFLKAMYLGLKDGAAGAFQSSLSLKFTGGRENGPDGVVGSPTGRAYTQGPLLRYPVHKMHPGAGETDRGVGAPASRRPTGQGRVIMAPLALPPGPYLDRLADNGLFSYTDGFNFHYYGYQEDFTGVYRQFEDAVGQLASREVRRYGEADGLTRGEALRGAGAASRNVRLYEKTLPVFITEYGYGLLDGAARNTVEGRVRQWRWFAAVAGQVNSLRIDAPMAFYWTPYFEAGLNEFGLTMKLPAGLSAAEGETPKSGVVGEFGGNGPDGVVGSPGAGGEQGGAPSMDFTPMDFGEDRVRPWMELIGKKIGNDYASPALAYLWEYAKRNPYRSRGWSIKAAPASSVVVDFIPGPELFQVKESGAFECRAGGRGADAVDSKDLSYDEGSGTVVIYNFSGREVRGRVITTGEGAGIEGLPAEVGLVAGQRLELPVKLTVRAESYVARQVKVQFIPDEKSVTVRAVFATRLLPASTGMRSQRVRSFDHTADAAETMRERLLKRPFASEEPRLRKDGRWLVSEGVRVEEIGGLWRFYITQMPSEPLSSAMIELPLPDDFRVEPDMLLGWESRLLPVHLRASSESITTRVTSASLGNVMAVYIRTENGNLFRAGSRVRLNPDWQSYAQAAEGFTMGFFGRADLPWRFFDNRPASLVFFIKPAELPAVVEIMDARLSRLLGGGGH